MSNTTPNQEQEKLPIFPEGDRNPVPEKKTDQKEDVKRGATQDQSKLEPPSSKQKPSQTSK